MTIALIAVGIVLLFALTAYVSHCTPPTYYNCTCVDEHGRADPLTCRGCR